MRAALGLAVALAACSPEIASEAYYCGPAEACPSGLVCDPASNLCVSPGGQGTFTCQEGVPLAPTTCLASTETTSGCVTGADGHDQPSFTTADGCAMQTTLTLTFPDAFMPLAATVRDPGGAAIATSAPCGAVHGGLVDACLDFTAQPATKYTIDVATAAGGTTCDGACAFNRYTLTVATTRP